MTDYFSDTALKSALDLSPDAPRADAAESGATGPDENGKDAPASGSEGDDPDPVPEEAPSGEPPLGALPVGSVEDGVSLHLMEPHDPGTIMVAVAEPVDMAGDPEPLRECANAGTGRAGHADADGGADAVEDILPRYGDLSNIAAVRLGGLGPALFFRTNGIPCATDDTVIVEMEEGHAFGVVASVMRVVPAHLEGGDGEEQALRSLIRIATDKDISAAESNREIAAESLEYCRGCIKERALDMKLVDVLVLHDRTKMIFYFTAPARIDFRELVKDLVRHYRTRIELRQIGVRHETQMVGALGNCGMVCCCRRYLRKFAPVAIKMAKEQNVFLNPVKISGICGRLLCCLAYEQEHYDEFYRSCPKLGKKYHTDAGVMRVLRASLFRESVTVLSETGEEVEYSLAEWNVLNPFRPNAPQIQQFPRKPIPQSGDGKRKNGGRGQQSDSLHGSQQDSHEQKKKEHSRKEPYREEPFPADADVPHPVIAVTEEVTFAVEGPGGVAAQQKNQPVTAVFEDGMEAGDSLDAEDSNDGDGAGGSIFGLSPRREASFPGNAQTDGDARRKRPHRRRKPRPAS